MNSKKVQKLIRDLKKGYRDKYKLIDEEMLIHLEEEHQTLKGAGRAIGVSDGTIRSAAKYVGYQWGDGKRKRLHASRDNIRRRYEEDGQTVEQVAHGMRISIASLRDMMRQYGIDERKEGELSSRQMLIRQAWTSEVRLCCQ